MVADYNSQYVSQTIALITSMSMAVKSEDIASIINDALLDTYGEGAVNDLAPSTWKYYMNLAGEYHPTDKVMTVTSLDTLEEIAFTKENLAEHSQTAEGYRLGTRLHKVLLNRYPTQVALIYGILYPCDKQTAIDAADGTILSYDARYVEEQEASLIYDLQQWVYTHLKKYTVSAYSLSGDLVVAARQSTLMSLMVSKVFALREKRVHTREAHSYHIRAYLASHGHLDRFYEYMKIGQILWLYRNLRYVERNQGKTEVFEALVTNLLNARYIPLADLSVRHTGTFGDDMYVKVHARAKVIGVDYNGVGTTYRDLQDLYDYEMDLNPGNSLWFEAQTDNLLKDFQLSRSGIVQTKLLASEMVDYTDSEIYPLMKLGMDEWGQRSHDGSYSTAITFTHPSTGSEVVMTVREAFIYTLYLMLSADGFDVTEVPRYVATKVERYPYPTVAELLKVAPTKEDVWRNYDFKALAEMILADRPTVNKIKTTKAFYSHIRSLFMVHQRDQFMVAKLDTSTIAGVVKAMCERTVRDVSLVFETGSMSDWLESRVIPKYDLDYTTAVKLIKQIYTLATGYDVTDVTRLPNIQKAMIAIMRQLSSYSVQYVSSINEDPVHTLNPMAIRPERIRVDVTGIDELRMEDRFNVGESLLEQSHGVVTDDITPEMALTDELTSVSMLAQGNSLELTDNGTITYGLDNQLPRVTWGEYGDVLAFLKYGALGAETFDVLSEDYKRHLLSLPLP